MRKNFQIRFRIETDVAEKLKKQAKENGIFMSELCRQKIKAPHPLVRIESILERIEKTSKQILEINNEKELSNSYHD